MRAINADALLGKFSFYDGVRIPEKDIDGFHNTVSYHDVKDEIRKAPTIEPTANWTPCSVGLPEKESLYIVTVRVCLLGATIIMTTVRGFYLKLGWSKSLYEDTVLAWMPLPEPYRGEA